MSQSQYPSGRCGIVAHLQRYPYSRPERLAASAAISDRVAQLSETFPMAFLALASGCGPAAARREALQRVLDGQPLAAVGAALGLPFCFRRIPPEGCCRLAAPFRWSAEASCLLAPHIPAEPRAAQPWLSGITFAARACHQPFAIWAARQSVLLQPHGLRPQAILALAVFAWHADRSGFEAADLGCAGWSPEINVATAASRAAMWLRHLKLHADLGPAGLADGWLPECEIAGYRIVPLTTPRALIEEASNMNHCAEIYSGALVANACRLFSLRWNGRRLATIEVRPDVRGRGMVIAQMKGPSNGDCPLDIWQAATRWIESAGRDMPAPPSRAAPPDGHGRLADLLAPYRRATMLERRRVATMTFRSLSVGLHELGRRLGLSRATLRWL